MPRIGTYKYQTFNLCKLKDLMGLGVKCNIKGIERYFNNPKSRIIVLQIYDPTSMGGGIGFTVHVSNPENNMLADMIWVKNRPWTDMQENNVGFVYLGSLDDYKSIAKEIAEHCCLPDMTLKA